MYVDCEKKKTPNKMEAIFIISSNIIHETVLPETLEDL